MIRLTLVCLLCAALAVPAIAEDPPTPSEGKPAVAEEKPKPDERVWTGYLWRDESGRIRMGWPVIAMGVMAQPAHVIGAPLAEKLTPLLTKVSSDWLFLNYVLEEPTAKALPKLPHVLVRIRGTVKVKGATDQPLFNRDNPRVMHDARLLGVEFLDAKWLEQWGTVYREPFSPFRIRDESRSKVEARIPKLAPKVLEALLAMQRRPLATVPQRALVTRIDRRAKLDDQFRKSREHDLIRWLRRENEQRGLGLEGLDDLGEVPPTGTEIQRLFLKAKTRGAFLKDIRARWKGELGHLTLPYYRKRGGATSWTEVDLETVASRWTDEQYVEFRALAKEMLGS